ncbi:MAG: hypothetical protein WC449_05040 [Candidatus Paceibacterota bacterium]
MNKEQLEGYLLACCDSIDRLIETGKLKEDDLAGKLAENLREYIRLNQPAGWQWWHYQTYPIYTTTSSSKICQYCGKTIGENELHFCSGCNTL